MKIVVLFGLLFMLGAQPLLMVLSLIGIVLTYSLVLYGEVGSYWFGFVLMLVMLSGVLVIFMYIISLFPNEGFEISNMIMLFMFFVYTYFYCLYYLLGFDSSLMTMKLWEGMIGAFNLCLVSFLLGIMVMVVWVSWVKEGAVRAGF